MNDTAEAELTDEERRFLSLVAPIGLNWISTRADFMQRHGRASYRNWTDVIALPATTALSASPLEFLMYSDAHTLDLPPEYLWADFLPHRDARRNHLEIEKQLQSTLGVPLVRDTSNCLVRVWSFGVFKACLRTFPPELQDPVLSRTGSNPLLDKNPELRTASRVTLESEYALVYPDARLNPVADLVRQMNRPGALNACRLKAHAANGKIRTHTPRRETRRNPRQLAELIPHDALVAWRDETSTYIGLSASRDSFIFADSPASRLVLVQKEPARGPGGFALDLESKGRADSSTFRLNLLEGGFTDQIETTAKQLSELWHLKIRKETGVDD